MNAFVKLFGELNVYKYLSIRLHQISAGEAKSHLPRARKTRCKVPNK